MTTARHRLLTKARIATAGLVLAAGSATGLLTVAAAQGTTAAGTTSTTDTGTGSGRSTGSNSSGSNGGSQSQSKPVASTHSS